MIDAASLKTGILTTPQLTAAGWSKWAIERALRSGALTRVRPGWFAGLEPADAAALVAVRAGGCVSCFSALRMHGVWVPEGTAGHVRLPQHQRRTAPRCRPFGAQAPVRRAVDSLEDAFRCVLRCGTREQIVVVIDSILRQRLASRDDVESWMRSAPSAVRSLLELADDRAESGTESMVRCRLWSLRVATRIQVRVMDGVRVDLLVGDRLIIECDSREHHTDARAYEADRRRDRRLARRGFIVLRLTYRQIHDEWPDIEHDILAIVRRGDHRWPRRRKLA
jgi:very-short-patch-repair endonuclease